MAQLTGLTHLNAPWRSVNDMATPTATGMLQLTALQGLQQLEWYAAGGLYGHKELLSQQVSGQCKLAALLLCWD